MEEQEYIQKPTESIKLSKGMTGKFGWEVKIIGESMNNYKLTDSELDRLDEINKRLMEKYGENNGSS